MGTANKFNKGRIFNYELTDDHTFISLKELFEKDGETAIYKVRGVYINTKGNYGDEAVAITDEYLVNLPKHLVETVKEIMLDDEAVEEINTGKFGFVITSYIPKNDVTVRYSVKWVNI